MIISVNVTAGFGDGLSSVLSLGLYNTADFRNDFGINGGVNKCSASYEYSKYTGYISGAGTALALGGAGLSAGLNGSSNTVFWTGSGAHIIGARLGTTIGKTPIGKLATKLGIENKWIWKQLSKQFLIRKDLPPHTETPLKIKPQRHNYEVS